MPENNSVPESDWFESSGELFISSDGLLRFPHPNERASVRLVSFAPAGADGFMFDGWASLLPESLELCNVQFPSEEQTASAAIEKLAKSLLQNAREGQKLVFIGVCMGSFWAYEVARHLRDTAGIQIDHLIVVTFPAPHLHSSATAFMRTPSFAQIMTSYFTPESPEYQYVLSRMPYAMHEADLVDNFVLQEDAPLQCTLTAFASEHDQVIDPKYLSSWESYTAAPFHIHMCDGDHFYGQVRREEFLQSVVGYIQEAVPSA
jgi:medium-chain acyl-[acyl-carrier-protein] hydrolase